MDEGPRYPGSLVVHHMKSQVTEVIDKYRRRRKRATELPRMVAFLLAWEGAIVAGAFLAAIAHVAASAYMMERFDERTRRTSLVRYYQQRTHLADEAVRDLQSSLAYYSRHAAAVERQLAGSTAAARECRQRLAERRRQLEQEVTEALGLGRTMTQARGGGGGGGGGVSGAGQSDSSSTTTISTGSSSGGGGGVTGAVMAPWRGLLVRWRLDGWRRELERLDEEGRHLESSLRHDRRLAEQARAKLRSLARELRREAAARDALQGRLRAWRSYNCRTLAFSAGGQTPVPSWWSRLRVPWGRRGGEGGSETTTDDEGGSGGGSRHGVGAVALVGEEAPLSTASGASATASAGGGEGARRAVGSGSGGGRAPAVVHDGSGGGGSGDGEGAVLWCWTMQVYVPTWMDDDEAFDFPPPPPRGAAPGDLGLQLDEEEEEEDEEGQEGKRAGAAAGGGGDAGGDFLSALRPLLGDVLPRW